MYYLFADVNGPTVKVQRDPNHVNCTNYTGAKASGLQENDFFFAAQSRRCPGCGGLIGQTDQGHTEALSITSD
jgi:hypothetical protein